MPNHRQEEEEEINVVDVSDEEDGDSCARSAPSCSRSSSIRSADGNDLQSHNQQPLDLSRKGSQSRTADNRPSVIKCQESFELPDVDEHFRKSLSFTPKQFNAEAKVDDHFARALGEVWWALKEKMQTESRSDEGSVSPSVRSSSPKRRSSPSGESTTPLCHMQVPFG